MHVKINTNNLPKNIKKYIDKRAAGNWSVAVEPDRLFNRIVVIPSIQEYENIPALLTSLALNDEESKRNTLFLFVVNNSPEHSDEIKEDNIKTIQLLATLAGVKNDYGLNISYIDAASAGNEIPVKDAGVGMARKIGVDLSLLYFNYNSPEKNIIIYLDGDCTVKENYLKVIRSEYNSSNTDAAVIRYEHPLENDAIISYEIFLRYYTLGLKYSGSPYSYHTVGSTITLTPDIYVKVGGMNKKKAGEDFYFLEKISKVTEIKNISATTVYPAARKSWRVPFGTGKRITKYYEDSSNEYFLYDPVIFDILKKWYELFLSSVNEPAVLLKKAEKIDSCLSGFLKENDFEEVMYKLQDNSGSVQQIQKQKTVWFDSFKTMKLIHFLRDKNYPNLPMFEALNIFFEKINRKYDFMWEQDGLPPVETQVKYLEVLRGLT